jgi:hypothetical protein
MGFHSPGTLVLLEIQLFSGHGYTEEVLQALVVPLVMG